MAESQGKPGALRALPILLLLVGGIAGAVLLRDAISFDTLRDNRAWLLAYRDAHFVMMALVFALIYIGIVTFSLPGAAVTSVTGGFLFGLGAGTALNVTSATTGATILFLAVRWGFGAALTARMADSSTCCGPRQFLSPRSWPQSVSSRQATPSTPQAP